MKIVVNVLFMLMISAYSLAQSQSEDFTLRKSVMDASGGRASSESYQAVTAIGQPTPIGKQNSESFLLHAGFLESPLAISPLSPIQNLVIQTIGPNVWLYWEHVPEANSYIIYRDTTAYFTPSPGTYLATTMDTLFVDANAIATPATKRYYIITSSTELPRGNLIISEELIRENKIP